MELTTRNHRQIHYTLLAINLIGFTLLTIAIVLTYNKNNVKSDLDDLLKDNHKLNELKSEQTEIRNELCPQYSPVHFKELTDLFGPYIDIEGVVGISDVLEGTYVCLGTLVHESVVLTSYKCLEKFDSKISEIEIRLYDESSKTLFNLMDDQYRSVTSYKVSEPGFLVLLFLDKPFNVKKTGLIALPRESQSDQCNRIIGNATLLKYADKLFQSNVRLITENDCFKYFGDVPRSPNHFCTENYGNLTFECKICD